MEIIRQQFPVVIYSTTRQFEGTFMPMGALMQDINDPERGDFALDEATITPLDPTFPFQEASMPQAIVRKINTQFFYFVDKSAHDKFRLLTRTEQIVVYTSTFALRGDFHLGAEQRIRDMFDTMNGIFQAMTDVTVFPLSKTRVAIPREIDLIMLNIQAIQFYHPGKSE